jgi:Xaa-Pro aminopeptidase
VKGAEAMNIIQEIQKKVLGKDNSHAALVTSDVSRRYITGFSSSAGIIVITPEKSCLFIDSRYYEKAVEVVRNCEVALKEAGRNEFYEQLSNFFVQHEIKNVSVESSALTLSECANFIEKFPGIEFDCTQILSDTIEKARTVKSRKEISFIKQAQKIADSAFNRLVEKIQYGMSEKQICALLNYYIMDFGGDGNSFDTIVASGVNSSVPHATPTDKKIEPGEFLLIDFGAKFNGYCSDTTRTIALGKPTDEMLRIYGAVMSANVDAQKAVRPEVTGKLIDNVARHTLEVWGYEKYFSHGLGHGVGLEIHEAPTLSSKSSNTLLENSVVTIEPGVYLNGRFGVRIEDMVVVGKDGCESLTQLPKSLMYI